MRRQPQSRMPVYSISSKIATQQNQLEINQIFVPSTKLAEKLLCIKIACNFLLPKKKNALASTFQCIFGIIKLNSKYGLLKKTDLL